MAAFVSVRSSRRKNPKIRACHATATIIARFSRWCKSHWGYVECVEERGTRILLRWRRQLLFPLGGRCGVLSFCLGDADGKWSCTSAGPGEGAVMHRASDADELVAPIAYGWLRLLFPSGPAPKRAHHDAGQGDGMRRAIGRRNTCFSGGATGRHPAIHATQGHSARGRPQSLPGGWW